MKLLYPLKGIGVVAGVYETQGFGWNPHIYAQFGLKGHNGIDWAAPRGYPIQAAHSGRLITNPKDPDGYGIYARVQWEEDGFTYDTVYGHMLKHNGGDRNVKAGEIIGYVNSTGFSTGDHLHFGIRKKIGDTVIDVNNGYAGYFDPRPFLTNTMSETRVVKSKTSDTIYLCYPVPSWQHLQERASLEGFEIPDKIPDTDSLT